MEIYKAKKENYLVQLDTINKKYNSISFFRLISIVLFLISIYYYLKTSEIVLIVLSVLLFGLFVFLMRFHSKLSFQKQMFNALIEINENEISYLERKKIPFGNGQEFNDFHHPYAYDLDIFGEHSLFQNLNRTATFIGKKTLAKQLLTLLPNEDILKNHDAIKELKDQLDWRQQFLAFAKISQDTQSSYETLLKWSTFESTPLSRATVLISYTSPLLFLGVFIAYLVSSNSVFISYLSYLFVFNLAVMGKFYKRIAIEIANAENVDKIINQYSLLVGKIENETFQSKKLVDLQQKLTFKKENASVHLKQLAALFSKMDSIGNFVTALLFNGTFLFNLHVLKALIQWKKDHAEALEDWLEVIGEFEMLNSLANLSYNNPEFIFPVINSNFEIEFSNLSHPLLNEKTRVGNEVTFHPQSFMILTGSNMSGKSTFLRSLGINMVLTGMGSPVCASSANVHPLPVLVSMRLSDSLSDSESYFFAEIKRLKQIMDELEERPAFVLLDEILRGTNSDDKRNGTIEVVKKVIAKKAIGAIATHDIEVCLTTNDYPNILTNKCFEVEIQNNELHFDYKLRDGICKNRSATFLMKKMGVI
ncbi:ABC-type branched-subunit amino acid transport system ATPase component [Flavobacterium sp. CG_9.10]|uniref:MutS-related protein n=1 Tax=Flavobacterium sp. CG_9.10 TaxID=2787729 RepID=UPI0018CB51CD|nr:DNA mismatch repair protein [Flavobacterium sp. CG_9.10]MBG6111692.1 ABC-type branched-subunit amino acid transport system ATPase component [Flavobacterium sp. CG_9.10]